MFFQINQNTTLSQRISSRIFTGTFALLVTFSACSHSNRSTTDSGFKVSPITPQSISEGMQIPVIEMNSQHYFAVEGTLSDKSFSRLSAKLSLTAQSDQNIAIRNEFDEIFKTLKSIGATYFNLNEELGYFTFYLPYSSSFTHSSTHSSLDANSDMIRELMAPLKALKFRHHLILNPVIPDTRTLSEIKAYTPEAEGLVPFSGSMRNGNPNFSGLARIHAPEFVRLAESEIGEGIKVNGDSVQLGITDTGITLNHPTFLSTDRSHNRITYMKDFTREGRVYFNLNAKFSAQESNKTEDGIFVTAEIIPTPRLPALPAGDQFAELKDVQFKASPEIKAILLAPKTTAKLGVLTENSFSSPSDPIDINGNGTTNDNIPIILIPGKTAAEDVLYVDISGNGDFRNVKPITHWNSSKATINAFAEQIGFDIQDDTLPSADGKKEVRVHSVSIVGFDPGNHGTHVAGIAAGSRTIANDDPSTLARGVAPDANISMSRICSNNGGCNATQAMIDLVQKGGAQVINMSVGGLNAFSDEFGVQETIINRLTLLKNVLFVVSAGNSGPGRQTVGSPSTARLALSVGASASYGLIQRQYQWPGGKNLRSPEEDQDFMLFFSGRGPSASGGFKPNLVAPGTELSAIRLNSAPGSRSGMDVYWGTSMAAPTAAGAYALLLDAITKYNTKHPEQALPSQASILRRVLIESAKAFDVRSYDTQSGIKSIGQYTWVDQGTGMIDLVTAWKKLGELRDSALPSPVNLHGAPVDLDYQVLIPSKTPNGNNYDGSIPSEGDPSFATGLYIDFYGSETLRPVHIARRLPFKANQIPEAGMLTRDLETTADEFVLKTVIYGSDLPWIKAGVLDQLGDDDDSNLDCEILDSANLLLLGKGADTQTNDNGVSALNPFPASTLNVCINRNIIRHQLSPGDHGALISAYRVVNGKVSPIPSFWIPVYVNVPHQTLAGSNGYQIESAVKSFGVSRNYVTVPSGSSLVQVTLEVPPLKLSPSGLPLPGEKCSGVELMALQGTNTDNLVPKRNAARISNCNTQGKPIEEAEKRRLVVTQVAPRAGTWDLHVFGQYKYATSKYRLKVDYLLANASIKEIAGGLNALNGSFSWNIRESSLSMTPDTSKSSFGIQSLFASIQAKLTQGQALVIPSTLPGADTQNELRSYPVETKSVTITTGNSPGNDIDLHIFECPSQQNHFATLQTCQEIGKSSGANDEESVTFTPKSGKLYGALAKGYDVKEGGEFTSTEKIEFAVENGSIMIENDLSGFKVSYGMTEDQVSKSQLFNSPLFNSGKYKVTGSLTLKTASQIPLFAMPVSIQK